MFALHAIILPMDGYPFTRAFFGKGQRSEDAVRTRLLPEHVGARVHLGPTIASKSELSVRYLILFEGLRSSYPNITGHWFPMARGVPELMIEASMRSMADAPGFRSSAEGMAAFRQAVGVDGDVMAAMLGIERSRYYRIERGQSKFTFEDYRRLLLWARRLDYADVFDECFPTATIKPLSEHCPYIPEAPGPDAQESAA